MTHSIDRREALRTLAIFSAAAVLPAGLVACSRKPSCQDVTGLSPEDVAQRQNTAAYAEPPADPTKPCAKCAQFVPGPQNACGTCKVVKGPISPEGGCKLFVPKPA